MKNGGIEQLARPELSCCGNATCRESSFFWCGFFFSPLLFAFLIKPTLCRRLVGRQKKNPPLHSVLKRVKDSLLSGIKMAANRCGWKDHIRRLYDFSLVELIGSLATSQILAFLCL